MFWKNFYDLCLEKGKSPNAVAKEIGVSSGSITKWKNDHVIPRESTLKIITEYFDTTIDDLLSNEPISRNKEKKPAAISSELDRDMQLISAMVNLLKPEQLDPVLSIMQDLPKLTEDQLLLAAALIRNMVK